jgi:hypothetical protein
MTPKTWWKELSNSTQPMRWLARFVALNVALVTVGLLSLWATGTFELAGLSTNGWWRCPSAPFSRRRSGSR